MKVNRLVMMAALIVSSAASAQKNTLPQSSAPRATIVASGEIAAAVARPDTAALSDAVLRVVRVESTYNVGVAVVRRNKIDGRTLHDALVHDAVAEVYRIIEGSGVLITGGSLESPKALTDDAHMSKLGPSSQGKYISGGTRTRVGPGDIVIIPPHTPHGFIEITTDHIVYTIIRIDPHGVLELHSKPR